MEREKLVIQPYQPERDGLAVYALWQENLQREWPISYERMQLVLKANEPEHFVARQGESIVGFVATGKSEPSAQRSGYIEAMFVAPERQRQGIGTLLHKFVLGHFQQNGMHTILLGAVSPRFWFAVPSNLSGAVAFFEKQGWDLSERSYDLVRSLKDFVLPEKIRQRMLKEEISIEPARPEQLSDILAFEEKEFAHWLRYFKDYAAMGDMQDLLIAWDKERRVVGSLIMISPQSQPERPEFTWKELLGRDMGGMMAVGVAESERGRGIGIALVAYGGERLRERGVDQCLIDWVVLTDFYGKLGWEKWREYRHGKRDIGEGDA